jgi:hypothetical protein
VKRSLITDDRGHRAPICRRSDLPPGTPARLRRAVNRANVHTAGFIIGAGLGAVMAQILIWVVLKPVPGGPRALIINGLGGLIGAFTALLIIWLVAARQFARAAARHCRHAGLCPSWPYDLRAAAIEPDGCAVCPECSCAWSPLTHANAA